MQWLLSSNLFTSSPIASLGYAPSFNHNCSPSLFWYLQEQTKKTASDPTAFKSGTYAYQVVDPHSVNCDIVVDNWKNAYTNFDGVPPAYKDNKTLYSNPNNVSLVAMYNPSDNASADCRVVTCTKTVTDDATEDPPKITEGSALICLTAPAALDKTRATGPFT